MEEEKCINCKRNAPFFCSGEIALVSYIKKNPKRFDIPMHVKYKETKKLYGTGLVITRKPIWVKKCGGCDCKKAEYAKDRVNV